MGIVCLICEEKFDKIIPWQHLAKHNTTPAEYKKTYGPIMSDDARAALAGRVPHNKGQKVIDPNHLLKIQQAIADREEKYSQGMLTKRGGRLRTVEERLIISEKTKGYALKNPDEMKLRAIKAIETKHKNGYDLGSNMRGKKHSTETKIKLRKSAEVGNFKKSQMSRQKAIENVHLANLQLLNSIVENTLELKCNQCDSEFSFTKQYFICVDKIKKEICPTCFPRHITQSAGEKELFSFISSLCDDAISGYRETYHSREIDIYVPSLKIGFEYNGLYWHSEDVLISNGRSAKSDHEKLLHFKEKGIRLIQIFEDEWVENQSIVKSRISAILGKSTERIFARKCQIKEVNSTDAANFCCENHIMGSARSNIRYGLYHQNQLVSLMTFTNKNISRKSDTWEINRFCSKKDLLIIGGASRLFKYFINNINPSEVISYADSRWSDGDLYQSIGFKLSSTGQPGYWYVLPNQIKRFHRYNLRKNVSDDQTLTEVQNRKNQGYSRIWDSGSSKWSWKQGEK